MNFHESFELIYRPMSKIGYKPTVAGNWGLSSLKVLQIVGQQEIEGTVMGQALDMSLDSSKAFVARMEKEYGKDFRWPVIAALGYDAGQVVLKALDTAKTIDPNGVTRCARGRRRHQGDLGDAGQAVRPKGSRVPGSGARVPRRLEERTGRAAEVLIRGRHSDRDQPA